MNPLADWMQANQAMLKKSSDAIALLTPDEGGRVISGPSKLPKLAELLQWQRLDDGLPDDDITILAAWSGGTVEAVFRDGEAWRLCHSGDAAAEAPTWWAEWPAGPTC
jgi:hypothetical protein